MKIRKTASEITGNAPRKDRYSKKKEPHIIVFFLLLALYFAATFFLIRARQTDGAIMLAGGAVPFQVFTGVFSSIANICIIFLVVYYKNLGFYTSLVLLLTQFPIMVIQFFRNNNLAGIPGAFTNILTIIAIILIYGRSKTIEEYQKFEVDNLKARQKFSVTLFEQTATALVNAIDAKDTYSHGHSLRVAQYSEMIAREAGKSEIECRMIYYAALLHDVGKIGISDNIINKTGRLTSDEYEIIKKHTVLGNQILLSISEYPYLSIGARYHHERYDGRGYPDRLKGDDIPEIARIISVADAYDAMTSNRSYREAMPQQLAREEIVKGAGTQFDPEFAKIMQKIIDLDEEYEFREKTAVSELAGKDELDCGEFRDSVSDGIVVDHNLKKIHLKVSRNKELPNESRGAAIVLFDSLDGRVHDDEMTISELNYFEYCEIWFNGNTVRKGARDIKTELALNRPENSRVQRQDHGIVYDIEAVKIKDHVQVRIDDGLSTATVIVALPDSSRYVYIGLTGEYCHIDDVSITREEKPIPVTYIKRIAEEISFLDGPEGDIPSIQVNGHRSEATEGVPITDRLELSFHTMSLPTARLIWHVPYMIIFSSEDGKVYGKNYKEYALVRLDGEVLGSDPRAVNTLTVHRQDDFEGWDDWKEKNREGFNSTVFLEKDRDVVTLTTENLGVSVRNVTTIPDKTADIYVALTGDQCALTDIRVRSGEGS